MCTNLQELWGVVVCVKDDKGNRNSHHIVIGTALHLVLKCYHQPQCVVTLQGMGKYSTTSSLLLTPTYFLDLHDSARSTLSPPLSYFKSV